MPTTSPIANKRVNVAVVGLGFMGVTHLRAHLDNPAVQIVAVCDARRILANGVLPGVAGNIKNSGDIHLGPHVKVFSDLAEMLADPAIEVVDLCTPTPVHPEQVIASLKAGKHVLCEKPLARTAASAREILSASASAPGFLMPAMCMRFWPGWAWLKQVVVEKTYGNVLAARFRRVSEMPAWSRNGTYTTGNDAGGALFDLHIHDADFVNYLFGRPAGVFASGVLNGSGSINHVVAQYHFPGGPAVHAEGSWLLAKGFNMQFTLHCERATLDYDLARGDDALIVAEDGQSSRTMKCEAGDGYTAELRYFVDCVANGRAPQTVTGHDGLTALEMCEAEEKSIRTGQPVKL
jgi:predicted dehydrogenase